MKKYIILIIAIAMIVLVCVKISNSFYVTTEDSEYCYKRGEEHFNMKDKNKIYYRTLNDCGKPLNAF